MLDKNKQKLYIIITISPRGAFGRKTQAEIIPFEPDKIMLDWEEDEIIAVYSYAFCVGVFCFA